MRHTGMRLNVDSVTRLIRFGTAHALPPEFGECFDDLRLRLHEP
jgi:hypothetical protein